MEFEVTAVAGVENCFVSLPLLFIQTLESSRSGLLPQLLTLELRSHSAAAGPWYVAWSGATSSSTAIEIAQQFAECISLPDHTTVQVRAVTNLPKATLVTIEPQTEDDWEVLELNAELAEAAILKQVRIVQEAMRFPLWLNGQTIITFHVVSTFPKKSVVQLVPGSEVAVAPKRREKHVDSHTQTSNSEHHISKAQLRLQDPDGKMVHKSNVRGVDLGVVLTSIAFIHPETAKNLSLDCLQLVSILPRLSAKESIKNLETDALRMKNSSASKEANGVLLNEKKGFRQAIVRLLISESVAKGHIMIAKSVRRYLRASLHSWVYVKGCNINLKKDVPVLSLSPCHFKVSKTENIRDKNLDVLDSRKFQETKNNIPKISSSNHVDVFDWSIHDEVIAALSNESPCNENKEPGHQSNTSIGLQSLLQAWFLAHFNALALNAKVETNSLVLSNETLLHFEMKDCKFGIPEEVHTPTDALLQKKISGELPHELLYVLSLSEESLDGGNVNAYELSFGEKKGTDNLGGLELLFGKLNMGDPLSFPSVKERISNKEFSSDISSLSWLETIASDVINNPSSFSIGVKSGKLAQGYAKCGSVRLSVASYAESHSISCTLCAKQTTPLLCVLQKFCFSPHSTTRILVLLSPASGMRYSSYSLPIPGHVLIYGPPGSGKTLLANAVAKFLEEYEGLLAHIVFVRCSGLALEKAPSIRQTLSSCISEALDHAPSVVIFDDLDSIISSASDSEGSQTSTSILALTEFLTDIVDEYGEKRKNTCGIGPIAFMASAQSLSNIPQSLSSSGRFDFHIQLPAPAASERKAILKHEIQRRSLQCSDDILLDVASKCDGYDAYDLEILVDRTVHAAIGRFLPSQSAFEKHEKPTLIRDDFSRAMHEFLPVAMRDITKSAPEGGRNGWDDVGGLTDIRNAIIEMIELPSKFPDIFAKAPLRLRSNVLLYGPPGCGKTHIVGAAAAGCSLRFISVKGPELLNKYIGASEQAVRDIFSKAAAAAPCLLFFDEFDSIAPKRGHDNTGVTDRVVNQFLTELDGVEVLTGVFVFAATSRPDLLDAALLRPGRLDRLLFCDFPSPRERLDILTVLARKLPLASDVDLDAIADMTEGFSGADLQALLSDAQLAAVHDILSGLDSTEHRKMPVITDSLLKSIASKARPSVSETEKQRLYGIYSQFLDSKRSLAAQSRDAKGKRATLA